MERNRCKMSEETKAKILELYHQGFMSIEIADKIGFSVSAVCRYIKSQGLPIQSRVHCSTDLQNEIVNKYKSGLTIKELHTLYPIYTEAWINGLLRKRNATRRNGVAPKLDAHYFANIDTEAKAYFLGLLFADGHIDYTHTGRNYTISISLNEEDGYLIEKFAEEVQTSLRVKHYHSSRDGRDRYTAILELHSKEMYEDLLALGMTEIKTENLNHLPLLKEDLMPHFIRGYFDGDGSVFHSFVKKTKLHNIGVNFCGTYSFLKELNAYLFPYLQIQSKGRKPFDRGNYASLHFSGRKACKNFFKFLYGNCATIYMKRKYNKFISFFDNYGKGDKQDG